MIDPMKHLDETMWAKLIGMHVFYQQPHMATPEYGTIKSVHAMPGLVHVLFGFDTTAKACRPEDLHWPPDFCKQDDANPPAQIFKGTT